jgi:hypothetical protein
MLGRLFWSKSNGRLSLAAVIRTGAGRVTLVEPSALATAILVNAAEVLGEISRDPTDRVGAKV